MKYLCLLLMLISLSCWEFDIELPPGAIRLYPPDIYKQWWVDVEQCSGIYGDYDDVIWYYIPNVSSFYSTTTEHPTTPILVGGIAKLRPRKIVVLAGDLVMNPYIVRHEMLHMLDNIVGHPPELYSINAPCANIIVVTTY